MVKGQHRQGTAGNQLLPDHQLVPPGRGLPVDGAEVIPLPVGPQLVVLASAPAVPPGGGHGRSSPLRQMDGARALTFWTHQGGRRRRRPDRQGEEPQAVRHPQPVQPAHQGAAPGGSHAPQLALPPPGTLKHRTKGPSLPGHPVLHPQPPAQTGNGQPGTAFHHQVPPGPAIPLHHSGPGPQLHAAAQHGGQAGQQSRQGQAQRQDEHKVDQVSNVKELADQGGQQRPAVGEPS